MQQSEPSYLERAIERAFSPLPSLQPRAETWPQYANRRASHVAIGLGSVGALLGLAWWPVSALLHSAAQRRALDLARVLGVLVALALVVAMRRSTFVRARATGFSLVALGLVALATLASVTLSRAPSDPLRASMALLAFATVPLLLPLRSRVVATLAFSLASLAAMAIDLDRSAIGAAISAHSLAALLSVATGSAIERSERALFEQRVETERHRARIASYADSLGARLGDLEREHSARAIEYEDERKSLARELHDELAHVQLGLRIELDLMRGERDHASLASGIASMQRLLDLLIERTRSMLVRLRPTLVDELGFEGAVRALVEDASNKTPARLSLELSTDAASRLHGPSALHAFRIVQEGLVNAVRHARASNIRIAVLEAERAVLLRVEDDGVGISGPTKELAFGLAGVRERAEALRGELEIGARAEGGTSLRVTLPLDSLGAAS
ncbi:MAG: hypothetical protein JNK05_15705 [Myxococcales bacterium]|nr:hypothetical protein [Myxococcales bacterium]